MKKKFVGNGVAEIDRLTLWWLDEVRNKHTSGGAALHPAVTLAYEENEFDTWPTTGDEVKALSEEEQSRRLDILKKVQGKDSSRFPTNGMQVSAAVISHLGNGRTHITVLPIRYLHRDAHEYVWRSQLLGPAERAETSPQLLHTSLQIVGEYEGRKGIFGQVKGADVLGSGAYHAGFVAGGTAPKDFDPKKVSYENGGEPAALREALKRRLFEEMGVDADSVDRSRFSFAIYEPDGGHVNIAAVMLGVQDGKDVIHRFENYMRSLPEGAKPQVQGIGFIPFKDNPVSDGLVLDEMVGIVYDTETQTVTPQMASVTTGAAIRPYTDAMNKYLAMPGAQKRLLDIVEGVEMQRERK